MPTKPTYEELVQRIQELEKHDQETFSRAFVNLLENSTDFLYFKDKEHRFTAVSQVFAELTGHKHWKDMIGKHDLEVFPKKDATVYFQAELPIMSEGKSLLNWREPYITPDGESGWVDTNKWPIKDRDGNVTGLFGISRDITQLVKAEETLKKSEENFRQLFEHSSLGIAVHELVYDSKEQPEDYILLNVNPAYCEILNLNADLVQGQRASQVYGVSPAPLLSEYASIVMIQNQSNLNFLSNRLTNGLKLKHTLINQTAL